jgi:hypothetical protein
MLAGVTIGDTLDHKEWSCTGRECMRNGSAFGYKGQVDVSLCGARVNSIKFRLDFIPIELFLVDEKLASSPIYHGYQTVTDVAAVRVDIANKHKQNGWLCPQIDELSVQCLSADGRSRLLHLEPRKIPGDLGTIFVLILKAGHQRDCKEDY